MNRNRNVFILHGILLLGGFFLGVIAFNLLPSIGKSIAYYAPEYAFAYWPALVWAWSFIFPIFLALFPLWKLFSSLKKKGGAFTEKNVNRLRLIGFFAFSDAVIFPTGMFLLGRMGAGQPMLTFIVTPLVIFLCVSAGIAMRMLAVLVEDAVKLREENELTI